MIRLTKFIESFTDVPIVSYISDDFYTNNQCSISPLFWINHFILRRHVREVFKLYSLVYTMTDEQKSQCEKDFGARMKILMKCGNFDGGLKTSINKPIRIVYAGGLYLNRWKTLSSLSEAIAKLNNENGGPFFRLDIYSNTLLKRRQVRKLTIGQSTFLHGVVSSYELKQIYNNSDIALHVEGFDLRNRMTVRMSFSTKIIDCLDSGCAVMAICAPEQAGYNYLLKNDAAICVDNIGNIKATLISIINNPNCLIEAQRKAMNLGKKNHTKDVIHTTVVKDFEELLSLHNPPAPQRG